ncbi:FusB/FusC family EF-G-binding protein [Salibacterium aidingense]|uniref:FusB/FusC family EF-G-binding protein n=1 Tax=Salibacterium aidingense TaxID=384933 RepID=UPI0003F674E6|nr:elongation factor G-binding protein [Salibacterium aidingense]
MTEPFIRNHHLNVIKNQGRYIQHCFRDVEDSNVMQAVKGQAADHVKDAFSALKEEEAAVIEPISEVTTSIGVEAFIGSVYPYVQPFPSLDKEQVRQLFPHHKKMQLPDLEAVDFSQRTYLGWNDPGHRKKFIVYELDGKLIGLEGRYTPSKKRDYCFFCQELMPVTLVSFETNDTDEGNPEFYRAIGQHICIDSGQCNKNITDVSRLEHFVRRVV